MSLRILSKKGPWASLLVFLPALTMGCSSGEDEAASPGPGGAPAAQLCSEDEDCDNGLFCDGVEKCSPQAQAADSKGCVQGEAIECEAEPDCLSECSEVAADCVVTAVDRDRDGHGSSQCAASPGDDCDDEDALRFPGNLEICDNAGHDEDCDPKTFGGDDFDQDGEVDVRCCNVDPKGGSNCGLDCDDLRRNVGPGNSEVCDGFDNDCDGAIDEGVTVVGYVDADFDLVGDLAAAAPICPGASGYSTVPGDCDDANPQRSPLYPESCDGIDNDCDGEVDEDPRPVPWYDEQDGDLYGSLFVPPVIACEAPDESSSMIGLDCDDTDASVGPFAIERCDALDNNCNGFAEYQIAPGDFEDDDGDGFADSSCEGGTDCDDEDPTTYPGALEREDGRDNDCNGKVDDQVVELLPWYKDDDGDGFGLTSTLKNAVSRPKGFSALAGDCDDSEDAIHPFAREVCNAIDDNCNGKVDEGAVNPDGGACLVCAVGTWDHDQDANTACESWTSCVAGEYASTVGTRVRDRECSPCPEGTFSDQADAESCVAHAACEVGERLATAGTPTTDSVCSACLPFQAGDGLTCFDSVDCSSESACPQNATCQEASPRDYCRCDAGYRGLGLYSELECVPECGELGLSCEASESCYIEEEASACVETAATCLEILNAGGSGGSGLYEIDPDGTGGADAFTVFCDMESEGGGWTLIREGRGGTASSVEGSPDGSGANVHLSKPAMMAIAAVSEQVMIYDSVRRYTFSDSGSQPILDLRAGKRMYDQNTSGIVIDYSSEWNGPLAGNMKGGYCGGVGDYPDGVFRACNSCSGTSWFEERAAWACTGWKDDKMSLLFR